MDEHFDAAQLLFWSRVQYRAVMLLVLQGLFGVALFYPLHVAGVIGAVAALVGLIAGRYWLRTRFYPPDEAELERRREAQRRAFESFVHYFAGENVPEDILHEVFRYFTDWCNERERGVLATLRIDGQLGMVDEGFGEMIFLLIWRCHQRKPLDAEWEDAAHVVTVADVVRPLAKYREARVSTA